MKKKKKNTITTDCSNNCNNVTVHCLHSFYVMTIHTVNRTKKIKYRGLILYVGQT